ncbi:MAG: hypothetical protein GKS05_12210 [Nitrospirales bacterium]|nr:hypothetical protein [Nitrospirales bacterium]
MPPLSFVETPVHPADLPRVVRDFHEIVPDRREQLPGFVMHKSEFPPRGIIARTIRDQAIAINTHLDDHGFSP